ncbi:Adiponectin receptor protein [Nymphon striatum]|nr:Adiponectin receptor protein [Nymphon striatum]
MESEDKCNPHPALKMTTTKSRRRNPILQLPEPKELDFPPEVSKRLLQESSYRPPTNSGLPEEDGLLSDVQDSLNADLDDDDLDDDDDIEDDEDDVNADVAAMTLTARAAEHAEQLVRKVMEEAWKVTHFQSLPHWLQDNDFLVKGHRPPLPSFCACFKSIFRMHTETGNIWSHLLGCIAFIGIAAYFLTRPTLDIHWQEKVVFTTFFAGAIVCLGLSFMFHTVHCHSPGVAKLFSKLDYVGIACLIIGSFIPWLYYGFYCQYQPKLIYMIVVFILGLAAIIVSLWDKFGQPRFRPLRAGVFMGFGLSGVIPAIHYLISNGLILAISEASMGWLLLMAALYITGALLYALRVPERFIPGKCDIWFQSHQIFHLFVLAAAFVHYHGITEMAIYRLTMGDCIDEGYNSVLTSIEA